MMEFYPKNDNLLGLNVNRGQQVRSSPLQNCHEPLPCRAGGTRRSSPTMGHRPPLMPAVACARLQVKVRLRPAGRLSEFYPFEFVLGTLLHELVHNEFGPHDQKFYKLLDTITEVCVRAQRAPLPTPRPPPSFRHDAMSFPVKRKGGDGFDAAAGCAGVRGRYVQGDQWVWHGFRRQECGQVGRAFARPQPTRGGPATRNARRCTEARAEQRHHALRRSQARWQQARYARPHPGGGASDIPLRPAGRCMLCFTVRLTVSKCTGWLCRTPRGGH